MNLALDLALAWGPDFFQPTQERLARLRDNLARIVSQGMYFAWKDGA